MITNEELNLLQDLAVRSLKQQVIIIFNADRTKTFACLSVAMHGPDKEHTEPTIQGMIEHLSKPGYEPISIDITDEMEEILYNYANKLSDYALMLTINLYDMGAHFFSLLKHDDTFDELNNYIADSYDNGYSYGLDFLDFYTDFIVFCKHLDKLIEEEEDHD
jgi:hypothetical protein